MREVTSGVHQVTRGVNSFVIDGDEGVVLVDTGIPRFHGAIEAGLAGIGRSLSDVVAILVTHAHMDHVGGLAALRAASGANVYASRADTPAVEGRVAMSPPPFADRIPFIRPVFGWLPSVAPVSVDHPVGAGPIDGLPEDITVIDTSGHTAGHVSYLLDRSGGVVFVGDAAVHTRGGGVKRGWMNRATPEFDASLRRLAATRFEIACFGHSKPLTVDASGAFQRFTSSLS
jgi:glyoxylase-like metal-dependent hydrolase (beta-lactamase superfamily II)